MSEFLYIKLFSKWQIMYIKYFLHAQLDTVKIHMILMYTFEDKTKWKQGKHFLLYKYYQQFMRNKI